MPVAQADDPGDGLNALIMGGTGMPTPGSQWVDSMITDYIDPATGNSYNPVVVTTPEALPVDHTVAEGLTDLQTAMAAQQAGRSRAPYVIAGYSQSALIAVDEEEQLAATAAAGRPIPNVTVALFGSGNRPDGGIYERLDGLYVPGLEVDANGAEPTDPASPPSTSLTNTTAWPMSRNILSTRSPTSTTYWESSTCTPATAPR